MTAASNDVINSVVFKKISRLIHLLFDSRWIQVSEPHHLPACFCPHQTWRHSSSSLRHTHTVWQVSGGLTVTAKHVMPVWMHLSHSSNRWWWRMYFHCLGWVCQCYIPRVSSCVTQWTVKGNALWVYPGSSKAWRGGHVCLCVLNNSSCDNSVSNCQLMMLSHVYYSSDYDSVHMFHLTS